MRDYLRRVRASSFQPATVIDVGVADGTFDLYHAFPASRFLLVEPLAEFEPSLRNICQRIDGIYEIVAATGEIGCRRIFFDGYLHGASLMAEEMYAREVRTATLDHLVEKHDLQPPYLLKVDVQGAEFEVLAGAEETLNCSEIVILEVPLFDFMDSGVTIVETLARMKDREFVPHDIFDGLLRPFDGALGQVDIAFVRENGIFRRERTWATPAQSQTGKRLNRLRRMIGI